MPIKKSVTTLQDLCALYVGKNLDKVKWAVHRILNDHQEQRLSFITSFELIRNIYF